MKNILVVGSSNTDMIIRVPRIPKPGETVLGGEFAMAPGGKGANQAVAAARAGGRVTFIARVGDDVFGSRALENFKADGIDTKFIVRDGSAPSGVALINVGSDGENAISVASGANAGLSEDDVADAAAAFDTANILLMQLETPPRTVLAGAREARKRGLPVMLNPAPARPLDDELVGLVSILTPNAPEAESLTGVSVSGESGVRRAADILRQRGPRVVVITLGDRGCFASSRDFEGFVPAFAVTAVDTTAAGDVFNGALAVALAEESGLAEGLRFASAAAAVSVTRRGAPPSAPARGEIVGFLSGAIRT
jgi:ribokinase